MGQAGPKGRGTLRCRGVRVKMHHRVVGTARSVPCVDFQVRKGALKSCAAGVWESRVGQEGRTRGQKGGKTGSRVWPLSRSKDLGLHVK